MSAQNEFAFFPGCVLSQAAKESKISLEAIAPILGIKLHEIKGWSCCGATQAQDVDPIATLVANARNLALAEGMNMPVLTTCSTCFLTLTRAKTALDRGQKDRINTFLAKGNMQYQGTTEVTSLLWVLYQNVENLRAKVVKPLSNLKVALFYGCHSLRPEKAIGNRESSVNPKSFETVVEALGAKIVPFEKRLDCCGFHASYPAVKSVQKMSSQIVNNADENGADCIVTPCPLCQMQLDIYQERYQDVQNSDARVPIIHLSQLVGLALGLSKEQLGFEHNIVNTNSVKVS
ncbi:8-methylmenaquinol:fumarate reductase membrane anchor subunit [Campylobacter sp.]|uniref:8-methylmenaquinol:fumarate reductase membrane anchor subunit n=1 Tax=Campylobacter sp. TaxID=205 RepID=UPI003620C572